MTLNDYVCVQETTDVLKMSRTSESCGWCVEWFYGLNKRFWKLSEQSVHLQNEWERFTPFSDFHFSPAVFLFNTEQIMRSRIFHPALAPQVTHLYIYFSLTCQQVNCECRQTPKLSERAVNGFVPSLLMCIWVSVWLLVVKTWFALSGVFQWWHTNKTNHTVLQLSHVLLPRVHLTV